LEDAYLEVVSGAEKKYKIKPDKKNEIKNKLVKEIDDKKLMNMSEAWDSTSTSGETYDKKLDDSLSTIDVTDKTELMNKIFNTWLSTVYNVYGLSEDAFETFLEDIQTQWNDESYAKEIEPAHLEAFNLFFEIVSTTDGIPLDLIGEKGFWANLYRVLNNKNIDKIKSGKRINIKVVDSYEVKKLVNYTKPKLNEKLKLFAGIALAFPSFVRNEFNKKLQMNNKTEIPEINKPGNFYNIKVDCVKGTYKLDENQVKELFKFVNSSGTKTRGDGYIEEYPDTVEYSDDKNSSSFEDFTKEIKKNKNAWAKDYNNNMYTRWNEDHNKIQNKWRKYTDADAKKDIESFKSGEGNCGHLCIFEDPGECNEFFEKMKKGDGFTYDYLAQMVNGNSFKSDYAKLKENIVKVNPAFVIGTLKAFKFDKWEKLNRDGTKTIKVESFRRWWQRNGTEFMKSPSEKPLSGMSEFKRHSNPDKEGKQLLLPQPPENLELFLKLLVAFINNNEFVLNPQSKNNIMHNRLKTTSIYPHSDSNPKELVIVEDGETKTVPNGAFKPEGTGTYTGSLGSALEQIKKNSGRYVPVESTPENRTVLNALAGLSFGWNPYGRLLFAKSSPNSTGLRYAGLYGGGFPDDIGNLRKDFRSCARAALDGLVIAKKSLEKKGKSIDEADIKKILNLIKELSLKENELYEILITIGKYEKIIDSLTDYDTGETVGLKQMDDAVVNYKDLANDVSTRSDGLTLLFSKLLDKKMSYSSL